MNATAKIGVISGPDSAAAQAAIAAAVGEWRAKGTRVAGVLSEEHGLPGRSCGAGYLRDMGWPHGGAIDIVQGEDMGMRSRLHADIPPAPGSSIRVSGTARMMEAD